MSNSDTTITPEPSSESLISPDALFLLDESRPDECLPITDSVFQVIQQAGNNGGRATGRQYIMIHFSPPPGNSRICELHWSIPEGTEFELHYGSRQLDVKLTTGYIPPFRPTWNSVITGNPPSLGPGVFGTVNVVAGTSAVVNTAQYTDGLGFVFKFADWVEQAGEAAGVRFFCHSTRSPPTIIGPYFRCI